MHKTTVNIVFSEEIPWKDLRMDEIIDYFLMYKIPSKGYK